MSLDSTNISPPQVPPLSMMCSPHQPSAWLPSTIDVKVNNSLELHLHKKGTPPWPSWLGSWNTCWAQCLSTTPCRRNLCQDEIFSSTQVETYSWHLHSMWSVSVTLRPALPVENTSKDWFDNSQISLWPGSLLWVVCKTSYWGAAYQDGPVQPGGIILLFSELYQ